MTENDMSTKQARAVAALLSAPTVREAAELAGVSERTLRRWLADPCFADALARAEDEAIGQAVRRLVTLQDQALGVLGVVLADKRASAAVRIRAAQIVLDDLIRLRELRDLGSRLSALEDQIGNLD